MSKTLIPHGSRYCAPMYSPVTIYPCCSRPKHPEGNSWKYETVEGVCECCKVIDGVCWTRVRISVFIDNIAARPRVSLFANDLRWDHDGGDEERSATFWRVIDGRSLDAVFVLLRVSIAFVICARNGGPFIAICHDHHKVSIRKLCDNNATWIYAMSK